MKKIETDYHNIHQDIIDKCKGGDQKAQFQLYKLYYKAMFNTSLRIVNDVAEAEDIMQESFFSAFEKINTYSGKVSFGAWMKKIVINNSLDYTKKRKIHFEPIDDSITELKEQEIHEELNNHNQQLKILKDTIFNLPEGYRVVLSLYILEGYDHEEIGKILNISSSTSRSQYARAKNKLIEALKNRRNIK